MDALIIFAIVFQAGAAIYMLTHRGETRTAARERRELIAAMDRTLQGNPRSDR